MQPTSTQADLQQGIDACLDCYQACFTDAMARCVSHRDRPVAAQHLGLMLNCAELCRTAAEFMMSGSPLHMRVCSACAEVCDACAESCEQVGGMDECVRACRQCADSCRTVAGMTVTQQGFFGSQPQDSDAPVKAPM